MIEDGKEQVMYEMWWAMQTRVPLYTFSLRCHACRQVHNTGQCLEDLVGEGGWMNSGYLDNGNVLSTVLIEAILLHSQE